MTSIAHVSVPASGASARPAPRALGGLGARAVQAPAAGRDPWPHEERRDAPADTGAHRPPPPLAALSADMATEAIHATLAARPGSDPVTPLQHASRAYRLAGAEPVHYGPEPRLFSIRA